MFGNLILKYRYLLCAIIFLVAVLLKLHMSSIGMFDEYVTDTVDGYELHSSVLLGKPRAVRVDEWARFTPKVLAQAATSEGFYPPMRHGISTLLEYYPPVFDWTALGKPMNWGFFFLSPEYAFSWLWSMKLLLLFMLSFEIGMILSGKKPFWGLVLGCLITFSPATQWWFFPHFIEVVFYAQALIVCSYYFITSQTRCFNYLFATFIGMALIGFCLSLYPALQISLGYVVLLFCLYFICQYWHEITKIHIYSWLSLAIAVSCALAILVNTVIENFDYLKLYSQTAYPGGRRSPGGDLSWQFLGHEFLNLFTPFKSSDLKGTNVCEVSAFFTLFPLPYLALFWYRFKNCKRTLIFGLLLLCIILLCWMFIGAPELLAKLTLFDYIPPSRLFMITYGITSSYFIVALMANKIAERKIASIYKLITLVVYVMFLITTLLSPFFNNYLTVKMQFIAFIVFSALGFTFIYCPVKVAAALLVCLCLFCGLSINPLAQGLSPIYQKQLTKFISEDSEDNVWATSFPPRELRNEFLAQFLTALGKNVFNKAQRYPDFSRFDPLDPNGEFRDIYNRAAWCRVSILPQGKVSFSLDHVNVIALKLPMQNLIDNTKINRILTNQPLNHKQFRFLWKSDNQGLYIYEVLRDPQLIASNEDFEALTIGTRDYNLDELTLITEKTLYNIDNLVDINTPMSKIARKEKISLYHEENLTIQGWAVDNLAKNNNSGVVFSVDNGEIFYIAENKITRPDVATHFSNNNYRKSGFTAYIPLSELSEGAHEITMIVLSSSGLQYYEACSFTIEILNRPVK
ncbi:MAG: hypothetical protein LUG50_00800 [Planctomycetaceae bacterium]|nr:hypothetical protein [Planctomycetaceae bacterium]